MSREFRAIERNRERLGIGLSDDQFAALIKQNERNGKRAERILGCMAVFVIAVCMYEPLAETLVAVAQFAVSALENLG